MFKSSLSSLSIKSRAITLVVLVAVAVTVVIADRFLSAPTHEMTRLSVLDSAIVATLDSVSIKQGDGGQELNFVRKGDTWTILERDYVVDRNNWESLINSFNALTIIEQASERDDRKAEYGLDPAQAIVVKGFAAGNIAFELSFGNNAAGSGILYASHPDKKGIFMTSGLARHLIERAPDLWIDRTLAKNLIEDDIESLRVENRDSSFVLDIKVEGVDSLGVKDYSVAINSVVLSDVDNSKVRQYLSKVANLRCTDVFTRGEFYDTTPFKNSNMTVTITARGGRTIKYNGIPNFKDGTDISFLLLHSGNSRVYEMSRHNMVSLVRREPHFVVDKTVE